MIKVRLIKVFSDLKTDNGMLLVLELISGKIKNGHQLIIDNKNYLTITNIEKDKVKTNGFVVSITGEEINAYTGPNFHEIYGKEFEVLPHE